jgi:DNA-binding transcriptional regulator GbsR (MarR family)
MIIENSIDWWRDQFFLATSDFFKDPNDITSAKIKSLLKAYQEQHERVESEFINDEHERLMDYR